MVCYLSLAMKNTATVPVTDTRNRRTPYHLREIYIAGDTPKKAQIIRSALRLGHPITVEGKKVINVWSEQNRLVFRVSGQKLLLTGEPLFHYVPRKL